jgi:hypothetical protein
VQPGSDDKYYFVENIEAHKKSLSSGKMLYFVKWKGYAHSDNTWEPREIFLETNGARKILMDYVARSS